ncbi:MAG: hypothetical protein GY816_00475 [Cytophagales bacterium]|nr:hypothetical protein [Cytophagales bacterium]
MSQNLLGTYIKNTLIVVVGVSILTTVFGVSSAWWIATTDFPFRKHLEWLLILPLAIPTFINGITYAGLIDYTGPIRVFLRSVPWLSDFNMDIMNRGGVIAVMSFVLYPYVYLTSRAVFSLQSSVLIEAKPDSTVVYGGGKGDKYSEKRRGGLFISVMRPCTQHIHRNDLFIDGIN